MSYIPEADDLRLVVGVVDHGSVGAAARALGTTQPSSSTRLARLERLVGVTLFDRDTRGARVTPAGIEMVEQARHILGHLERAVDAVRLAGGGRRLRVGTIASLAEAVLPVLDEALAGESETVVDHGSLLLAWLGEGTLDAAVLAVADQVGVPPVLRRHRIGDDRLRVMLPPGVVVGRGARRWRDLPAVVATYDGRGGEIATRLASRGLQPRQAATIPTALALARRRGCAAVVPGSALGPAALRRGERVIDCPVDHHSRIDLVVPRQADPRVLGARGRLQDELGLT